MFPVRVSALYICSEKNNKLSYPHQEIVYGIKTLLVKLENCVLLPQFIKNTNNPSRRIVCMVVKASRIHAF